MKYLKLVSIVCMALLCGSIFAEVNLNTATEQELMDGLANIGPQKAAAIVSYRKKYGPFGSVDEIVGVKGIGMATLEKNRHLMTVGEQSGHESGEAAEREEKTMKKKQPDASPEVVREAVEEDPSH